ncbi:MAG: hypothetical protein Q9227_001210 [Pyrenula ochraceoflavens]
MDRPSDIVERFHLRNTTIAGNVTTHIKYHSDSKNGTRRDRIEERWQRTSSLLGHGSCGNVWLERNVDSGGELRAVKIILKRSGRMMHFDPRNEARALSILSADENAGLFVEFYGWWEHSDMLFLAMEYVGYGDLDTHLSPPRPKTLHEQDTSVICRQILEGLTFIHKANFVHRDLKPGNILIQRPAPSWWVKIGDFGISRRIEEEILENRWTGEGTIGYKAPEIRFAEKTPHTNKVDLWSLGCVVFKTLTGEVPFPDKRALDEFCHNPSTFHETLSRLKPVSVLARQFLMSLVDAEPAARLSAEVAMTAPWILTHWKRNSATN